MASKLTALTEATVVDNANDFLLMTDVSDTTMAASGTTKKVNPDKLPISTAQAAVNADLATYDVPGKPPSLNVDGNLDAILTVRAGTAAELNIIVLNANELAIQKNATTSKPEVLRAGDGSTAGGFQIAGSAVINKGFGGAYPAAPTCISTSVFTDIPGTELGTLPRGLFISFYAQFLVPATCGLEFYWAPLRNTTIKIYGGPAGFDLDYFIEGPITTTFLPTTEDGLYYVSGSGIVVTSGLPAYTARFRCKAVPGGADTLTCLGFYAESRQIPIPPL